MVLFLEILSELYHVPQSIHSYICEQSGQLEWSCYWRRFLSLLRFFLLLFFCLVYKLFQGIFDRRMKQNYFLPYPYTLIYLPEPKLCWKFGLREFKMLLLFYISMFFSLPSSSVRGCVLELEELSLEDFSSLFSFRPCWKWMSWASSFAGEFTRREQATGGECGGYSTTIALREEESEDGT